MYPILFAVLSSFAFGMVAGVVASWTITALRERSPEPHGGMPGENSAESGADADLAPAVSGSRQNWDHSRSG